MQYYSNLYQQHTGGIWDVKKSLRTTTTGPRGPPNVVRTEHVFTQICSNGWTCCREHAGPVVGDVGRSVSDGHASLLVTVVMQTEQNKT